MRMLAVVLLCASILAQTPAPLPPPANSKMPAARKRLEPILKQKMEGEAKDRAEERAQCQLKPVSGLSLAEAQHREIVRLQACHEAAVHAAEFYRRKLMAVYAGETQVDFKTGVFTFNDPELNRGTY